MFANAARRDVAALDKRTRQAVLEALGRFESDPSGADLKKLRGFEDRWRVRVGRYRAIVRMDNDKGALEVLRVLRRDVACR